MNYTKSRLKGNTPSVLQVFLRTLNDTALCPQLRDDLRLYANRSDLTASEQCDIGAYFVGHVSRALPASLCLPAITLCTALPKWLEAHPADAIGVFGALGVRLPFSADSCPLCFGISAAASAATRAHRARVSESAPAAAHALLPYVSASHVDALNALCALARAAPDALVPSWGLFLSSGAPVSRALLHCPNATARAAAADVCTALLAGGRRFVGARARGTGAPFTTAAERAGHVTAAVCKTIATALKAEKDGVVLTKLAKTGAAIANAMLSRDNVDALLSALVCTSHTAKGDATVQAAALTALAAVVGSLGNKLERTAVDLVADVAIDVLKCVDDASTHVPREEALVVLQAVCDACVHVFRSRWDVLQPRFGALVRSRREVLVLHTVRVVEHALGTMIAEASLGSKEADWAADMYMSLAAKQHDHSFHAVRSSAALCAEYLLRLAALRTLDSGAVSAARSALLKAALGDDVIAVQCLAVRSLGAMPQRLCTPDDVLAVVRALHCLMQLDTCDALQSRCAWALASLIDKLTATGAGLLTDNSRTLLETISEHSIDLLRHRKIALENGTPRNSDGDARATGLVRLLCASKRGEALINEEVVFVDAALDALCGVVSCEEEAPKARWNGCRALGDILPNARSQGIEATVCVLYDVSTKARSAKVRMAAARALQPYTIHVGVRESILLYINAKAFTDAPRAQCDAHVAAAATLVHNALNVPVNVHDAAEGRAMIEAIATHAELPNYVFNSRAQLPPAELGAAAPEAVLAALNGRTRSALSVAIESARSVAHGDAELMALCEHLRERM